MSLLDSLASSIARMEGFGVAGARATRNNNPGNLRDSSYRIYPTIPRDAGGFLVFPDAVSGWDALKRDLSIKVGRGWSLSQVISAWAPSADGNDTAGYIQTVSRWLSLPADLPLFAWSSAGSGAGAWPSFDLDSGSDQWLMPAAVVAAIAGLWFALA